MLACTLILYDCMPEYSWYIGLEFKYICLKEVMGSLNKWSVHVCLCGFVCVVCVCVCVVCLCMTFISWPYYYRTLNTHLSTGCPIKIIYLQGVHWYIYIYPQWVLWKNIYQNLPMHLPIQGVPRNAFSHRMYQETRRPIQGVQEMHLLTGSTKKCVVLYWVF